MAELLRIGYGKEAVSVYRTDGVSTLFAAEVGMTARGEAFVPSYTDGDNTVVVATDSMKNFIHMTALEYEEASLEGFLEVLARRFMDTYEQAARIELNGREVPFARRSEQSFQSVRGDYGVAELALDRDGTLEHRCGREGLRLMKLTGSSFEGFVRDEYTTLPESRDRPLFVHLDVHWRNTDFARARGRRGGPRLPGRDLRGVRLGLDPGARPRDGRQGARRISRDRRDLVRGPEQALGHRAGVRGGRARSRLHGSAAPVRAHRADPRAMIVPGRFNGPPDSGNGGYTCGLVAGLLGEVAEVTLRLPPPLDRELRGGARRRARGDP